MMQAGTVQDHQNMIAEISNQLVTARRTATALTDFPGHLPEDAQTAYAVQHYSINAWPRQLAGFKVGGIAPKFRTQFGANWLAGAIFDDEIFQIENGEKRDAAVFKNGFAAYEAEWMLVVEGIDWAALPNIDLETARSMVTRLHMGMEIASSPMPMINELGPGAIISDFGNNISAWIGPEADLSVLNALEQFPVRTLIDGKCFGEKAASSGPEGPVGALAFLLNHLRHYRDELILPQTLLVSSGAVTGVHDSHIGTTGQIEFSGVGQFALTLVEKPPLTQS